MEIRLSKKQTIDDDVVLVLLSEFADWLDENGLLRETGTFKFEFNEELGKKFVEQHDYVAGTQ